MKSVSQSVVSNSSPPMDCSLQGSSVHRILQPRILEWVAIPFSRGSSWPRDQTGVFCTAGRFFTIWTTREVHPSTDMGSQDFVKRKMQVIKECDLIFVLKDHTGLYIVHIEKHWGYISCCHWQSLDGGNEWLKTYLYPFYIYTHLNECVFTSVFFKKEGKVKS